MVIDAQDVPFGIIPEIKLKAYTYLRHGGEILRNRVLGKRVPDLVERCPIADLATPTEDILDMYVSGGARYGAIITERLRYVGFLSSGALLNLLAEKRVQMAQDQNPLTRLPGNHSIGEHVANVLRASAVLLSLDSNRSPITPDQIGTLLASGKKLVKNNPRGLAWGSAEAWLKEMPAFEVE